MKAALTTRSAALGTRPAATQAPVLSQRVRAYQGFTRQILSGGIRSGLSRSLRWSARVRRRGASGSATPPPEPAALTCSRVTPAHL